MSVGGSWRYPAGGGRNTAVRLAALLRLPGHRMQKVAGLTGSPKKEVSRMKVSSLIIKAAVVAVLAGLVSFPAFPGLPGSAQASVLTVDEAAGLAFQREEEKLARDVYLTLYAKWGVVIFSHIARSEQRHTDTLKKMLDKYGLPDPALPTIGAFTNPGLQAKYAGLVADGLLSYVDGLHVGATIEEIDMIDIERALDATIRLDLRTAYQNLLEGSKNHLRAFVARLAAEGIVYAPQFVSVELYESIIGL